MHAGRYFACIRSLAFYLGNDRPVSDFLPVEQQRVAGDGDNIPDLGPVIHGDHTVFFDERGTLCVPMYRGAFVPPCLRAFPPNFFS